MKFDQLGLVFDGKLSAVNKAVRLVEAVPEELEFGTVQTMFGSMTLVWCDKGLCYLGFEEKRSLEKVQKFFPAATLSRDQSEAERYKDDVLGVWQGERAIDLVIAGTRFQRDVWNVLLHIPAGHVVSYGSVAEYIGRPNAVRAVGSAVGANPVSLLIPCHRVIQGNGSLCNYGWGDSMKQRILKEEVALTRDSENHASRKSRRVV